MIRIIALLCGVLGSCSSYCFSWSDLWFTADQQGQHSMSKADYRKAQQQFERRDWAATAAYRAGDYKTAAQLFQQRASADDYYNHGNALAHLGQYEEALKAYNQALKLNPQHEDARFNHKLISDLLKKDQEKKQNKEQDKDKQDKDKQDKDKQDKDKQDKQQSEAERAAEKEKEQAKQQWLRLIPDDPGGLIREKFLRDHIRRERGWYQ